jgi:hypothetical protein
MRRIAAFLWATIVLSLFGCIGVMLFATQAQGQERPITSWPSTWTGVVFDFSMNDKTGCIAGWAPAPDRYSEPLLQIAFVDGARLTGAAQAEISRGITTQSLAALSAVRYVPVFSITPDGRWLDPIAQPCYDKLKPPAAPWIVAPITSGKRPVYALKADGTRGAQWGYASVTLTGNGKTAANWCECYRWRSKETTSSTYCAPAIAQPSVASAPLVPVVTLCRAGQ